MTKFLKLVGGNVHQKYLVHANWSGIRNDIDITGHFGTTVVLTLVLY